MRRWENFWEMGRQQIMAGEWDSEILCNEFLRWIWWISVFFVSGYIKEIKIDLHRFTRDLSFRGISHFSGTGVGDTFCFESIWIATLWSFEVSIPISGILHLQQCFKDLAVCFPSAKSPVFFQFPGTCATPGLAYRAEWGQGEVSVALFHLDASRWNIWNSIPNLLPKWKNQA